MARAVRVPGGEFAMGTEAGDEDSGAWVDTDPKFLTVWHRHEVLPDTYSYSIGFRIAIETR